MLIQIHNILLGFRLKKILKFLKLLAVNVNAVNDLNYINLADALKLLLPEFTTLLKKRALS
jgi:hypothetical protein